MTQIFGNSDTYGLVDSMTMEEFDERMNALNTEWEIGGAEMVEFKEYFRKYKEDELKYHVMKVAVKAAEITGTTYGYYSLLLILILRSTTKVLQLVGGIFQNEIFRKERSAFNMLYMGQPTSTTSLGKLTVSQSISCEFRITKAYIF